MKYVCLTQQTDEDLFELQENMKTTQKRVIDMS
jgi:hypothetical protein